MSALQIGLLAYGVGALLLGAFFLEAFVRIVVAVVRRFAR